MVKAAPLLLLLSACTSLSSRAADFADCWRAEAHLGLGAWAQAGPVAHAGMGMPEGLLLGMSLGGWRYGYDLPRIEGHTDFPTEVYGIIGHASSLPGSDQEEMAHTCFILLPPILGLEGPHSYWLHDADVEVGGGFVLCFTLGFSPGEFLDFLLGWFGIDLAGDDGDGREPRREARSYYRAAAGKAPIVPAKTR